MNVVILVGVPGCGKSTVLQEVTKQIPAVHIVNYGDCMLQEALPAGVDRDGMRKMPTHELQRVGIQAAKKMLSLQSGTIIVDTHALIRTPTGYCPGIPREVLEILRPKVYAWVDCLPDTILQRRLQDTSRRRDVETREELALHQEMTRAFLAACSMHTGSALCRIDNNGGAIDQNVAPLVRLIQEWSY